MRQALRRAARRHITLVSYAEAGLDAVAAVAEHLGLDYDEPLRVLGYGTGAERLAADVLAAIEGAEQAEFARRAAVLGALCQHAGCPEIIGALTAERDDLLAGIDEAVRFCNWEAYETQYGDRVVAVADLRDALAPEKERSRPRPESACEECGSGGAWSLHEDGCWTAGEDERLQHKVLSHGHCQEIAQSLFEETAALHARIEPALRHLQSNGREAGDHDSTVVVDADDIPDLLCE